MNIFLQTAEHSINAAAGADSLSNLPEVIREHTGWDYICWQTEAGCYLKPAFRKMPYRNSFVPEIDIAVSCREGYTKWRISGQPVRAVRIFMALWFGFLLILEAVFLALAVASKLERIFPIFIPLGMVVFGYLLCQMATKLTFRSVVKVLHKETK